MVSRCAHEVSLQVSCKHLYWLSNDEKRNGWILDPLVTIRSGSYFNQFINLAIFPSHDCHGDTVELLWESVLRWRLPGILSLKAHSTVCKTSSLYAPKESGCSVCILGPMLNEKHFWFFPKAVLFKVRLPGKKPLAPRYSAPLAHKWRVTVNLHWQLNGLESPGRQFSTHSTWGGKIQPEFPT